MTHKRYQNPHKGYSRSQYRTQASVAIDEELEFDAELARTRFAEQSITALMAGSSSGESEAEPTGGAPTSPQAAVADAGPPDAAVRPTRVRRGAMTPQGAPPDTPKMRMIDRLLAMLKRAR